MTKHTVCILAIFTMFLLQFSQRIAFAQDAVPRVTSKPVGDDFQPITDEDIQMMRKDIRSQRKQIIAANLKLTDAEAEKFWPVYEQYVSDLVNINGTKYALIKQYVETRGALTDTEADTSTNRWVAVDQSVAELRKNVHSDLPQGPVSEEHRALLSIGSTCSADDRPPIGSVTSDD